MFKFTTEKKKKHGFYIVLFIVIGIMLSTGTLLMTKEQKPAAEQESASFPEQPKGTPIPVTTAAPTQTPLPTMQPTASPTIEPTATPEPETPKEFLPQWPVYGEVIVPFSGNELVYSKTLEDWRVHTGVDIKSSILAQVTAAFDGTVESVTNDPLMGITIVIDHGENKKTVYSNLSSMEMVQPGKTVKTGDVISGVGDTALIETGEEAHIHFEIWIDGAPVDPQTYLK